MSLRCGCGRVFVEEAKKYVWMELDLVLLEGNSCAGW